MDQPPSPPRPESEELQFDRVEAEGADRSGGASCGACHRPIADLYYEVNGGTVCPACRDRIAAATTGGRAVRRLFKATLFGFVGAAIGAGIYFAVLALSGYEIGLIAIVVGVIVGIGVRAGSEGRGGWAYQLLAMFLTYCAIVATYVPMIVAEIEDSSNESPPVVSTEDSAVSPTGSDAGTSADTTTSQPVEASQSPDADSQESEPPPPPDGLLRVLLYVLAFVLAFISPILAFDPMGYLIKGIALYEAWVINKRTQVTVNGPYRLAAGGASAPAVEGGA